MAKFPQETEKTISEKLFHALTGMTALTEQQRLLVSLPLNGALNILSLDGRPRRLFTIGILERMLWMGPQHLSNSGACDKPFVMAHALHCTDKRGFTHLRHKNSR